MAVISRGQITIVDLSDGKSINLYLGSNVALTQIYNKKNSTYSPNWSASPFLVITPEGPRYGSPDQSGLPPERASDMEDQRLGQPCHLWSYGSDRCALCIDDQKQHGLLCTDDVECEVTYVDPDTTAETKAKTSISYAKTENAGQARLRHRLCSEQDGLQERRCGQA